jgi:hypothetical protein
VGKTSEQLRPRSLSGLLHWNGKTWSRAATGPGGMTGGVTGPGGMTGGVTGPGGMTGGVTGPGGVTRRRFLN